MVAMFEERAQDILARDAALHDWLKAHKTNGYKLSELPPELDPPTNEERSACEVYLFKRDKPQRYVGYVQCPADWREIGRHGLGKAQALHGRTGALTTWTGDKLGSVVFGRAWRDNFGGIRVPVTVRAITGEEYHGTYFYSAGDYARINKSLGHSV